MLQNSNNTIIYKPDGIYSDSTFFEYGYLLIFATFPMNLILFTNILCVAITIMNHIREVLNLNK